MNKSMTALDELFMTNGFVDNLIQSLENLDRTNFWPDLMAKKCVEPEKNVLD